MKIRILIPMMVVLWFWGFSVLLPSGPARAAQGLFLGDKHKSRGMDCSACHKGKPAEAECSHDGLPGMPWGLTGRSRQKTERNSIRIPMTRIWERRSAGKCHHSHKGLRECLRRLSFPCDFKVP